MGIAKRHFGVDNATASDKVHRTSSWSMSDVPKRVAVFKAALKKICDDFEAPMRMVWESCMCFDNKFVEEQEWIGQGPS
jgi:hypothetical protein